MPVEIENSRCDRVRPVASGRGTAAVIAVVGLSVLFASRLDVKKLCTVGVVDGPATCIDLFSISYRM
jgi:hypothetical protein